jgi:hypothetical protein
MNGLIEDHDQPLLRAVISCPMQGAHKSPQQMATQQALAYAEEVLILRARNAIHPAAGAVPADVVGPRCIVVLAEHPANHASSCGHGTVSVEPHASSERLVAAVSLRENVGRTLTRCEPDMSSLVSSVHDNPSRMGGYRDTAHGA